MDIQTAYKLIEENLHTIFAWSFSKLYDKAEAEDMTQDIIYAALKSVHRLEKDEAFYGFIWRIAENTLRTRLRRKRSENVSADDSFCGVYWTTPEDEFIKSEEIQLLRRELSLLSNQYREVTVRYYIHGKSCAEISTELNISIEMVKYYLFKTRKILKEGIGMTREFGEKSYNPQTFRSDFWGGCSIPYHELFERRLPGNIVLSAYDKPMSVTELSVELGVSSVYLEDELQILQKHDIIKKIGDKYQTNIIIFTDEYDKCAHEKFKNVYKKSAELFNQALSEALPRLKKLTFYNNGFDDNCLKWVFANIAMYHAVIQSDRLGKEKYGEYPLLSNGSYGFVFGYDYTREERHFNGIYAHSENREQTAWVSVENYRILERCQNFYPHSWDKSMSAMLDAVLFKNADESNDELIRLIDEGFIRAENGKLSPNFCVFSEAVFNEIKEELTPTSDAACGCMAEICDISAKLLKNYVPKALQDKCGQLAHIRYQMDVMAFILEANVKKGQLIIPDERVNPCMFGVDKR